MDYDAIASTTDEWLQQTFLLNCDYKIQGRQERFFVSKMRYLTKFSVLARFTSIRDFSKLKLEN